jgi:DNA-binding Xre family transcriptional regulator
MPRSNKPKPMPGSHIGHADTYRPYIRWNLAAIARNRGFAYTKGPRAGRVNIYALQRYTGVSYAILAALCNEGYHPWLGFGTLGKLCALLNTTPGELLYFDPNMSPAGYALPPAIAATGRETVQVEW